MGAQEILSLGKNNNPNIWSPKYSDLLSCTWLWSCWNDVNNNTLSLSPCWKRKEGRLKQKEWFRMIVEIQDKTNKIPPTTSQHFQARAPKAFFPTLKTLTHLRYCHQILLQALGDNKLLSIYVPKERHPFPPGTFSSNDFFLFFFPSSEWRCSQSNSTCCQNVSPAH